MYIDVKFLTLLGILFWALIFTTDILRRGYETIEPPFENIRALPVVSQKLQPPPLPTPPPIIENTETKETVASSRTWTVFLNLVICFVLVLLGVLRISSGFIKKLFNTNKEPISPTSAINVTSTKSETNLLERKLSTMDMTLRTQSCQTLFQCPVIIKTAPNTILKSECERLREELSSIHSNSIKEHALLSRKLETSIKEKKELSKRLLVLQKENQTAKEQLEEFIMEKKDLQAKLGNATKEFRQNTKAKKLALAKLDEISIVAEDLKHRLDRVTEEKYMLQGKLDALRTEYEKIQTRLETKKTEKTDGQREDGLVQKPSSELSLMTDMSKESLFLPYALSQTEMDMRNIQMRIIQLEKNLQEFRPTISGIDLDLDKYEETSITTITSSYSDALTTDEENEKDKAGHGLISNSVIFQQFLKSIGAETKPTLIDKDCEIPEDE